MALDDESGGQVLTSEIATKTLMEFYASSIGKLREIDFRPYRWVTDSAARTLSRFDFPESAQFQEIFALMPKESEARAICNLSGLESISDRAFHLLMDLPCVLNLSGLTTISDVAAQSVREFKGGSLILTGITGITDAASKYFSECTSTIDLNGLRRITPSLASTFAQSQVRCFDSLTTIDLQSLYIFVERHHCLNLESLHTLPMAGPAPKFTTSDINYLRLPSVLRLTGDSARLLRSIPRAIYLDGVKQLHDDTASVLFGDGFHGASQRKHPTFSFRGIEFIDDSLVERLILFPGTVFLSPSHMERFTTSPIWGRRRGTIRFDVHSMPLPVAEEPNRLTARRALQIASGALAEEQLQLIETIDVAGIAALGNSDFSSNSGEYDFHDELSEKVFDFKVLPSINALVARNLSNLPGTIKLDALRDVDATTLEELSPSRAHHIQLNGLRSIRPDQAEALAKFRCRRGLRRKMELSLNGIESLCPEAAEALSQFVGWLSLGQIQQMDDETFSVLCGAGSRLRGVELRGLAALSSTCCHILHESNVRVVLSSTIDCRPDARQMIEKKVCWD